jgi:hypothetical protein
VRVGEIAARAALDVELPFFHVRGFAPGVCSSFLAIGI